MKAHRFVSAEKVKDVAFTAYQVAFKSSMRQNLDITCVRSESRAVLVRCVLCPCDQRRRRK